ncbi:hypothetical protein EYZ11_011006 [Aspergillus tanneri]|uniref:Uncharacterized protein n=1 Tax=Aspergillus tanneri TaxID=1220188 RepID=A0A4S3J9C3_9EURO|nr:hypothetical protein EYZ11_011006 [Aspergillus tanneri]
MSTKLITDRWESLSSPEMQSSIVHCRSETRISFIVPDEALRKDNKLLEVCFQAQFVGMDEVADSLC